MTVETAFENWWSAWRRMESVRELSRVAFLAGWTAALLARDRKVGDAR